MRYKKLGLIEQVSQKKRCNDGVKKISLKFGSNGIFVFKTCRFEYAYFNIIKRYLKAFLKIKYSRVQFTKVWIFLKANFPIRKKSKNSRMGKGIGSFLRWSIRLRRGCSLVEFRGISEIRLKKLLINWKKHLSIPIFLI